ncbi:MAG: reprolysin-like metallopeptidase [Aestuariibaculum sp.]
MKAKLHYVFSIAMVLSVFSVFGQELPWEKLNDDRLTKDISKLNLDSEKVYFYKLNFSVLKKNLDKIPFQIPKSSERTKLNLPTEEGRLQTFFIYESSVFSAKLAAKYPHIKSYVGFASNNSDIRLRMSVSHNGIETMISYPDRPTVFMQPIKKGSNKYVVYQRSSRKKPFNTFECKTIETLNTTLKRSNKTALNEGGANTKTLQKFRIAISTMAEYTAYHYISDPVADALAAINTTLSRVNEVFENDMAIRFELVDATQLIYTDAATDPYSDAGVGADGAWSTELQNTLTTEIGNAAYDVGHLFGASGGGGDAGCIGCVCVDGQKGSGFTSPANNIPEGDSFDIDFVAHEIGHQMGANHTFAFENEGAGVSAEPGSGSTIMGYAGLENQNNVQLDSDDYFHYHSIKQILDNLQTKSCQTTEVITNNSPIANAGADYHIPAGTPYILKGSATDTDAGDNLTYCWEQTDSGMTNYLNFGPELAEGSVNRSLPPTNIPERHIPKFASVLAGNIIQTNPTLNSDWETVSTVARTLNWALTVRDRSPNNASGGQTSFDTMQITVEEVAPFTVENPVSWTQGETETIVWNVGETNNATINCQLVNIKLSIDGGTTFTTLISNIPNNGSYSYTVPAIADTENARLLIEAADNIFYDVSDFDFTITSAPDFYIANETLMPINCGDNKAVFNFDYEVSNGFSETTVFSITGQPVGTSVTFTPESLSASGNVTMEINHLDAITNGDYNITIEGTATTKTKTKIFNLPFYNSICKSEANNEYETSTTLVTLNTINQASGKPSGYSDYTNVTTNLNRNSSYNLTVRVNTDGDYDVTTLVWIDWNQNCSFNDAGEAYILGDTTNATDGETGNSPLSVTVPDNAVMGSTIMRVSTKYKNDGTPTACENGFDGEVEDYTLNIIPSTTIETNGFENLSVFPNPNNGLFTVTLNGTLDSTIDIGIFDIRNRLIFKKTFQNPGDFNQDIQLNNTQTGMYILRISDDKKTETKKIIIR